MYQRLRYYNRKLAQRGQIEKQQLEFLLLYPDPYLSSKKGVQKFYQIAYFHQIKYMVLKKSYAVGQNIEEEHNKNKEEQLSETTMVQNQKESQQTLKQEISNLIIEKKQCLFDHHEIKDLIKEAWSKADLKDLDIFGDYREEVVKVCAGKHHCEEKDYPQIGFQEFKQIHGLWMIRSPEVTQQNVPGCKYLKIKHLQLLKQQRCLNDEVILEYISLLKKWKEKKKEIKLINSLQVSAYFEESRYDSQKLMKFLEKERITHEKCTVLLPVFSRNIKHWFFIKFSPRGLEIYDSLKLKSVKNYTMMPIVHNASQFWTHKYGKALTVKLCLNFPQQTNGYDCGVMMLCGIKDLCRGYLTWSFNSGDVCYKRLQQTKQLIDHELD